MSPHNCQPIQPPDEEPENGFYFPSCNEREVKRKMRSIRALAAATDHRNPRPGRAWQQTAAAAVAKRTRTYNQQWAALLSSSQSHCGATNCTSSCRSCVGIRPAAVVMSPCPRRSGRADGSLLPSSVRSLSTTTATDSTTTEACTDVLIVGGGVVGCTVARQLSKRLPDLTIGLVEAGPGYPALTAATLEAASPRQLPPLVPHPRSYALCPASLEALGIVRQQQDGSNCPFLDGRLGYYRSMQVWEASQPSTLVLDRSDAEDLGLEFLGAVVEDSVLARYLWETTIHPSVDRVWTRARVHGVTGLDPSSLVQVEIAQQDGTVEKHETRLLVAADGAHSAIRRFAGIAQSASFDYEQTALTVTVEVDRPLNGRCFQRFLASGGPLALLPTFSPNHAIVVWSTTAEQVEHWKDHPDLARHLSELLDCGPENFDPWFPSPSSSDWSFPAPLLRNLMYGAERLIETLPVATSLAILDHGRPFVAPPHLLGVASPVLTFPLSLKHADRYVAPRLALVGDAAHTVHPMAGQGLNLGVQDAVALVDAAVSAIQAGMDPTAYLSSYESKRQAEVAATLGGIHALHSLFGFQNGALKYLKALGMTAVQSAKPLRRELVRVACLGVGSRK